MQQELQLNLLASYFKGFKIKDNVSFTSELYSRLGTYQIMSGLEMGLYIGCVLLWVSGAFNKSLTVPALWCMFVFMLGIGLGRALSLILDGMPDTIFVFFMIFEFIAAGITFYLLKAKA